MSDSVLPYRKVSIGMPVYNGSSCISRAIDSLLAQSFRDFELIISDNASTDETQDICVDYVKKDSRIRYIRQESNISVLPNFDFVLNISSGDYFMWAAHDDEWDSNYIEKLLRVYKDSDASTVAVTSEAQYTVEGKKQELFAEGEGFYGLCGDSVYARACHMLKYNYGNLFYSLYKRDALFSEGVSNLSRLQATSLNEVPLFLQVVAHGCWKVIPEPLFYKQTKEATYVQARWEMQGGFLPFGSLRHYIGGLYYGFKYHVLATADICRAIALLPQGLKQRVKLYVRANVILFIHFVALIIRYKPGKSL